MGSNATNAVKAKDSVVLIPWDTENQAQSQRLFDQRVACTWDYEVVEEWKGTVRKGTKLMYWIVLSEETERRDTMMEDHLRRFPKESEPLIDTATKMGNAPVMPTKRAFVPIGHIGMEVFPKLNEEFSLPPLTYWVKSLYISGALQSGGLGRKAMHQIERTASSPPFNCSVIALDTVTGAFQRSEESLKGFYDDRGLPRPEEVRTNEDWYLRQGYEIMGMKEAAYMWTHPETGDVVPVPCVYLKKDL